MCIMLENEAVLNNISYLQVLTEYLRIFPFIVIQKATAQGQIFTSIRDVQLHLILPGLCLVKTTPHYSNKNIQNVLWCFCAYTKLLAYVEMLGC